VRLGYEAAVCGGIPIIHALQRDLLGDSVTP
jgi:homoserine dehydrogenase